jgi:hypothetical protein
LVIAEANLSAFREFLYGAEARDPFLIHEGLLDIINLVLLPYSRTRRDQNICILMDEPPLPLKKASVDAAD